MSKLSDLTTKYDKLLEEVDKTKCEILIALGTKPQAMLSPFGTTTFTTNANVHNENWHTGVIKFKPEKKSVYPRNGRSKRLLRYIKRHYKNDTFSIKGMLTRIGSTDKHQKNLNYVAISQMCYAKKLRRVGKGLYKLNKGV